MFSRTVCVFKVKFELFPLVQFIFLFFCVSLNALDRENTLTNSDTHTGRRNLSFFRVCLSYIHTSYLFCTCALRVLLLLLSSLSFFFFFLFYVVIRCHCRLLLCLEFFFPSTHCSILGMTTILIDGVHHAIAIKYTLHKCACLVFDLIL